MNPRAIETMSKDGIDISYHTSNNINKYRDIDFDFVITLCDNAKERCPFFPSSGKKFHHNLHEPDKAKGTEEEIVQELWHVRGMMKDYCREFVDENL